MVSKFWGDEVIKALNRELYKGADHIIKATVVLDEMRGVKMVPQHHRAADRAVLGEQTAKE